METKTKINFVKIVLIAGIVSAFLLAITAVLPSIADSNSTYSSQDIGVTATKTAEWTDMDYTKGQVQITAKATGKDEFTPNVLFIGTLCGAHDLSVHTIEASLDAIAANCNVDYFFYNNAETDTKSTPDFNNTLTKGHAFKEQMSPEILSIYQAETWNQEKGKWDTTLVTRNHQALKKFLSCIYTQIIEKQKSYDFIVLEFDKTRISDWYRNLVPDNDPSGTIPAGNYSKFSNENDVANILSSYYDNNQVIWITDSDVVDGQKDSLYWPDRSMNVRTYDLQTRIINYNSLKALLAPKLYVNTSDTPSSTDAELREIEKNLDGNKFDEKYVLGFDRQVGYADSSKAGDFLKEAIESLYEYQIVIKDKINTANNLKVTNGSVLFEMRNSDSEAWVEVPADMKPQVTVNYETGEVTASVAKLRGDKQFRLSIGFEDKSLTERFINVSPNGNPNDGTAEVEVTPGAGVKPDPATPGTEVPLDWEIPIYYVVEDRYKETEGISVSNPEDNISTSSSQPPEGSTAQETNKIKFQYWSTLIEGKDTFVSNDFYYQPMPDSTTNRYKSATYIAHYAESPEETKHLIVQKLWSDGDDFHLDDVVNVHLFVKDVTGKEAKLASNIQLSAANKWIYTTEYEYQIYDVDGTTPLQYYFVEDEISGYAASYDIDVSDPEKYGNTIITNTYIAPPGPGPQPIPTPDPGNVTPVGYGSVKTGDIVNVISLLIIAALGGVSIVIINKVRNKKNKERG